MSLASRLSSFFLATLGLTLAGFSGSLFLLTRAYMQRHLDEHIVSALDAATPSARAGPGGVDWVPAATGRPLRMEPGVEDIFWIAYDDGGREVARSANAPAGDFSRADSPEPDHEGHSHGSTTGPDGRRWRLSQRRIRPDPSAAAPRGDDAEDGGPVAGRPPAPAAPRGHDEEDEEDEEEGGRPVAGPFPAMILTAGAPLAPLETALRNLALALAGLSTALWALAGAAGRRLCRRALAPMARMAGAARAMTAADRGQHLPSPGTGDELEELSGAFNGLLDRMHDALARQERFAGDASHQLRTPLTALLGQVEVARRRDRSPEEYRRVLDAIHDDADRLRQVVEALLFLVRAEAEAALPVLGPVDLAAWLPGQLARWSAHARGCDIRLAVDPRGPLPARVHAPLLAQLVDNLVENACRYSDPGSPIAVRLGREAGSVVLAVEDRGVGVSADELPHLFEPFYRSPAARLRGGGGVGLGLAVVRRIALAFGGTVEARGEPGAGARFVVRLPESGGPAAPGGPAPPR